MRSSRLVRMWGRRIPERADFRRGREVGVQTDRVLVLYFDVDP
jgi:hypothetical protein